MDADERELIRQIDKLDNIIGQREVALAALRHKVTGLLRYHSQRIRQSKAKLRLAKRMLVKLRLGRKYGLSIRR